MLSPAPAAGFRPAVVAQRLLEEVHPALLVLGLLEFGLLF
jgi:hypothetical protein